MGHRLALGPWQQPLGGRVAVGAAHQDQAVGGQPAGVAVTVVEQGVTGEPLARSRYIY